MESYDVAQMLGTVAAVMANQFKDRLMLGNAEQLNDLLTGKGIERWASNIAFTSQFKVAGALGTIPQVPVTIQLYDPASPATMPIRFRLELVSGGTIAIASLYQA